MILSDDAVMNAEKSGEWAVAERGVFGGGGNSSINKLGRIILDLVESHRALTAAPAEVKDFGQMAQDMLDGFIETGEARPQNISDVFKSVWNARGVADLKAIQEYPGAHDWGCHEAIHRIDAK